ncbi:MAG: hypothetical protein KGQ26_06240 [Rhodospirillales bacterium]|nr:hypothetical protein [Rhodospirillales bacterium]
MIRLALGAACLSFCVVFAPAKAAPLLSITPALPETTWALPAKVCGGFVADQLNLVVSDRGKILAQNTFCSSYGSAKARLITDHAHHHFVLLEYKAGRGANATTTYLALDRLDPELTEVLRVPLSWGTGPTARFTYHYTVGLPAPGGVDLILKGQEDGRPDCCVPRASNLTIHVSN